MSRFKTGGRTAARLRRCAGILLAVALAACSNEPAPQAPSAVVPDFELPTVDGGTFRLADHRGQVLLLDFWATWCPPCRAAIPHLNELQRKYRDAGLVVVGMNLDQDPDELARFLERTTFNYPVARVDEATRNLFGGVPSIPLAVLIDRKGRVRKKIMGFSTEIAEQTERRVADLLAEPPPP